ncbi:UNVERIFIED_CONTAM: Cellulose synthase-like protein G3, partial [Sesamum radiatum]
APSPPDFQPSFRSSLLRRHLRRALPPRRNPPPAPHHHLPFFLHNPFHGYVRYYPRFHVAELTGLPHEPRHHKTLPRKPPKSSKSAGGFPGAGRVHMHGGPVQGAAHEGGCNRLSVMAYDYPTEKLSIYVSDDGGSELTLFALIEAAKFGKVWLPFCKENRVLERCPEAYFGSEFAARNSESEKIKLRVSAVMTNAPTILTLDCDMVSNDPSTPLKMLCYFMDNSIGPQLSVGFRYGSLVEDYYTGYRLHCEGWKSVYCSPERPAFLSEMPIALNDVVSDPWFFLYVFLFLGAYGQDYVEFVLAKGTTLRWWSDQRMWLIRILTSDLFGTLEYISNQLGIATRSFNVTSKVNDDELKNRYDEGKFEFGVPSPMFVPLSTVAIINLAAFFGDFHKS